MVFALFSSEKERIAWPGIKINKNQGRRRKKGRSEAEPVIKRSFTKKKLAKMPKRMVMI